VDNYRPDHFDLTGAAICLIGVAVIMYAPRS
jgi:small multidrug resistance family-3 protein